MPSRAATAAAKEAAAVAAEAPPAPQPPPPPPDGPPDSLMLLPGHPPGWCLQTSLYLHSDTFHALLSTDIRNLFSAYEQAVAEQEQEEEQQSPFQRFRRVWKEQGRDKVHLLAMVDGPMRVPWGDSVLRGFLEYLKPTESHINQVAAFFAIYTFWGSQATTMQHIFIKVDPPTLNYILTLPTLLAPSLTPAPDAVNPLSLSPSLDLTFILHQLITSDAFFIVPTETFMFPELPCVSIADVKAAQLRETALRVLGAEEEVEALRRGRLEDEEEEEEREGGEGSVSGDERGEKDSPEPEASTSRRKRKRGGGGGGNDTTGDNRLPTIEDYAIPEFDWNDEKGWRAELEEVQAEYLKVKRDKFPRAGLVAAATTTTGLGLVREQLVDAAEDRTARAVAESGGTGVESLLNEAGARGRGRGLLRLVAEVTDKGGKGLAMFEEAVKDLEKAGEETEVAMVVDQ